MKPHVNEPKRWRKKSYILWLSFDLRAKGEKSLTLRPPFSSYFCFILSTLFSYVCLTIWFFVVMYLSPTNKKLYNKMYLIYTVVRFIFDDKTHLTFKRLTLYTWMWYESDSMSEVCWKPTSTNTKKNNLHSTPLFHNMNLLSRCGMVKRIYWFNLKIERRSLVLFHLINVYFFDRNVFFPSRYIWWDASCMIYAFCLMIFNYRITSQTSYVNHLLAGAASFGFWLRFGILI